MSAAGREFFEEAERSSVVSLSTRCHILLGVVERCDGPGNDSRVPFTADRIDASGTARLCARRPRVNRGILERQAFPHRLGPVPSVERFADAFAIQRSISVPSHHKGHEHFAALVYLRPLPRCGHFFR